MAFSYFNSVPRSYTNVALSTTATLALDRESLPRIGVIITNNSPLGGADLIVSLSSDFATAPATHTASPFIRVPAGASFDLNAGRDVAVWLSAAAGTVSVALCELVA